MTLVFFHRRRAGRIGLGLGFWLVSQGCGAGPEVFVQSLAEKECQFAQRCTPGIFERRCRACVKHEECPAGACDLRAGLCQDALGRPIPGLAHQARCDGSQACGGYVCAARYADESSCVQAGRAHHQISLQRFLLRQEDPTKGCAFRTELADECLRESDIRGCEEPAPRSCDLALRDCQ